MCVSRCSVIKVISKSCELFIVQLSKKTIININIIYGHYLPALLYECFIALANVLCIIKLKQCFINSPFVQVRLWWIIWQLSSNWFYKQTEKMDSQEHISTGLLNIISTKETSVQFQKRTNKEIKGFTKRQKQSMVTYFTWTYVLNIFYLI